MNTINLTLSATCLAAAALVLTACPGPTAGPDDTIIDPGGLKPCESSEECSTGNVCSGGLCILGSCDPALELACDTEGLDGPYCCKPWELCSTLSFQCENDPNVDGIGCDADDPTCTPCEVQSDCAFGQFCSGATCLNTADRTECTSSFQCPTGERCDRSVFLCVPDRGACQFCGPDFPELCCEDGQLCSESTGFCIDIPDAECTDNTDCNPGTFCDSVNRCVQCDDDGDCGPGLLCDEGEGECFRDSSCTEDEDCFGNQLCAPGSQQCTLPTCLDDADCEDAENDDRYVCDTDFFLCELPPPVCDDDADEPNDSAEEASPIVDNAFAGTLCRDDTDILAFTVNPNRRYTATVDFGGSGQGGIIVTMLGNDLTVESTRQFAANESRVQVAGVTGPAESGTFYVKIQGNNDDNDFWTYTVTVAEDEPSQPADCTEAGQPEEDNNTFETAHELTLGETRTFSRCGTGDVDFYRVAVPPLNGVQVTMAGFFNAEGNLNIELFKAPNTSAGSRIDSGTNVNDIEIVDGAEVSREFWIKVSLASPAGAVTDQTYRLGTVAVPRPEACFPDPTEDDGSFETAAPLTLTGAVTPSVVVTDLVRCNPQDEDFFRFTMPPNLGGNVLLRFTHSEGDMRLELFRADDIDGAPLATSNTSNANSDPDEQVSVPGGTEPIEYVAVAKLNGSTGGIIGQRYTLEVQTFDDSQCIASEPSGGDEEFARGRCVGDFTPLRDDQDCINDVRIDEPMLDATLAVCEAAPEGTVDGCGRMCGNGDSDWYRVGILNNDQVLHAVLEYDPTEGELGLARGTLNTSTGSVTETSTNDTDHDGRIDLFFAAPRNQEREYGVRVRPIGTTGHQVQPYALQIEVGAECVDDANDVGALKNEKPVEATDIRPNFDEDTPLAFVSSDVSRCSNDIDVYRFVAFAGESITVELDQVDTSPNGLTVELGTRPDNFATATSAPLVEGIDAIAVAGEAPITFTNPIGQELFVTVRSPTGTTITGPYILRVSAN